MDFADGDCLLRRYYGPEFTALLVREWLERLEVQTLFIEPGSSWENGYVESFNGKFRDELLDREIFYTLRGAQILIERWRRQYNAERPHSGLNGQTPEEFLRRLAAKDLAEKRKS